jgi:hypothetical protein
MMTLLSRWFEPTAPAQDYGRAHYVILLLLLVAALG